MTPGHFGLAAGAKKLAPQVPLWAFFVSTYVLDIFFLFLWLAGVESLAPIDPSQPNAYGGILIHAEYTHSLLGAVLISLTAGWLAGRRWGRQGRWAITAVTFSHWILDLLVHRPDLPILPGNVGNLPLLGLGLWELPAVSKVIELAFVLGGAYLYHRSITNRNGRALAVSLAVTSFLLLLFIGTT